MNLFKFMQMLFATQMARMAWDHDTLALIVFAVLFIVAWFTEIALDEKRSTR